MSNKEIQIYTPQLTEALATTIPTVWFALKGILVGTPQATLEVIFLLAFGVLFGAFNSSQLCKQLGIGKDGVYNQLKGHTPYLWRRLIQELGYKLVVDALQRLQLKSAATQSRANLTLILDDSLFIRLSEEMALVYKWWGGALRRVGQGQDLMGVVLVVGDQIIPLELLIATKQGKKKLTKVELARRILAEAAYRLKTIGIDLALIEVVADSWFSNSPLIDYTLKLGFTWASESKTSYVFYVKGIRYTASQLRELPLDSGWGGENTSLFHAISPTFGHVIIVLWKDIHKVRCLIVKSPRHVRALQITRAFKVRPKIEVLWRLLKTTLKTLEMKLRSPSGARAQVAIRMISFYLLVILQPLCSAHKIPPKQNLTFGQLMDIYQRSGIVPFVIKKQFQMINSKTTYFISKL